MQIDPRDPQRSPTRDRVGAAAERAFKGDLDGAIADLRAIVADSPTLASAWAALGLVLEEAQQGERAAEALARSSELDPSDPRPLRASGRLLYQLGRYPEAKAALERAHALDPKDARTLHALGLSHEACGDAAAAIAAYRDAARLDPELIDPKRALADLLADKARLEQAAGLLDEVLEAQPDDEAARRNRNALAHAIAHARRERLLGRPVSTLAGSAIVTRAALALMPEPDGTVHAYRTALLQVIAWRDAEGAVVRLLLTFPSPASAASQPDTAFGVTIVGADGKAHPADLATAASVTFLGDALGVSLTRASGIYAELLGRNGPIEVDGARVRFGTLPVGASVAHGLIVE